MKHLNWDEAVPELIHSSLHSMHMQLLCHFHIHLDLLFTMIDRNSACQFLAEVSFSLQTQKICAYNFP